MIEKFLKKAHKKERIREAEVQLLKQEQQNKIFSAMIEGQEKERKRLAIDLHDSLGGRLSGISMNLSKLDKDEPKAPWLFSPCKIRDIFKTHLLEVKHTDDQCQVNLEDYVIDEDNENE